MKTAYLAGPISGCSFGECTDWRVYAERALRAWGINGLSPMRGKDFLRHVEKFTDDCAQYSDNPLSSPRGIMTRDFHDATTCDVLLVNLLGATKVSIGTVLEIGWAYQKRTPIVVVMEADGTNPHEHSMIHEAIGYRVTTLAEAIEITRLIVGADLPAPLPMPLPAPYPIYPTMPMPPAFPNFEVIPLTGAAPATPYPAPTTCPSMPARTVIGPLTIHSEQAIADDIQRRFADCKRADGLDGNAR